MSAPPSARGDRPHIDAGDAEKWNHGHEPDAIGEQPAPVPAPVHAARIEDLAHRIVTLAHPVKIDQVDGGPRREQVQEHGEEFAEFLDRVFGRGECEGARDDGCDCEREHPPGAGRAAEIERIHHAQQRERGSIEIERGYGERGRAASRAAAACRIPVYRIGGRPQRGRNFEFRIKGGGERADQHGPGAADERPEVGPPEAGADADVRGR